MDEEILICYIFIFIFILLRLVLFGVLEFFHMFLSIFVLVTIYTIVFLFYDSWLEKNLSEKQIDKTIKNTFKDINNLTTIVKTRKVNLTFPQDQIEKDRNDKIVRNSLLVGTIPLVVILTMLFHIDPKFYTNIYKNFTSILLLYGIELYFSWLIISEFDGEGLENIRHEILTKLKTL